MQEQLTFRTAAHDQAGKNLTARFVPALKLFTPQFGHLLTGPPTDTYALGVLLYELLACEPPFRDKNPIETIRKVVTEEPTPPSSVRKGTPGDLETICLKCLRKKPAQRYASAEKLADDLRHYQNGEPIEARPVGRVERTVKWAKRHPALSATVGVFLVLLTSAIMIGLWTRWATHASDRVQALLRADIDQVPSTSAELDGYRWWANPLLDNALADANQQADQIVRQIEEAGSEEETPKEAEAKKKKAEAKKIVDALKLRICLALLDEDASHRNYLLARLLDAEPQEVAVIVKMLSRSHAQLGQSFLNAELAKELPKKEPARERDSKRKANAAAALLIMNQADKVWPLLNFEPESNPDPRVRNYLIHMLGPAHADHKIITSRLDEKPDATRRALILSLGEFDLDKWPVGDLAAVTEKLKKIYREEPDPGLHTAAEWLLRTWKHEPWLKQTNDQWANDEMLRVKRLQEIKKTAANDNVKRPPEWYVNKQGQTLVVIPGPVEFMMGSPITEPHRRPGDERQHKKRISRTFAIATKAVTFEQYQRFDPGYQLEDKTYSRMKNMPVVGTSWFQAAEYCNWLSEQENLECCYDTDDKKRVVSRKANYLSLSGYRLPTEAEMECATRAGALTARYYGETDDLMPHYAWYMKNSKERTWPVGWKKPNDLGFFDVHGNVFIWCQEAYERYPETEIEVIHEDRERALEVDKTLKGLIRGGSFVNNASYVRSANRVFYLPGTSEILDIGCRPARTILPR